MPVSTADAYVLPSLVYASSAVGISVSFHAPTSAVMSLTIPASACWKSTPPPQVWKMSGGSPAWMTVVSLVLKASFSSGVISNVTPGCAASNWLGHLRPLRHHRIGVRDVPPPDLLARRPDSHRRRRIRPGASRPRRRPRVRAVSGGRLGSKTSRWLPFGDWAGASNGETCGRQSTNFHVARARYDPTPGRSIVFRPSHPCDPASSRRRCDGHSARNDRSGTEISAGRRAARPAIR